MPKNSAEYVVMNGEFTFVSYCYYKFIWLQTYLLHILLQIYVLNVYQMCVAIVQELIHKNLDAV